MRKFIVRISLVLFPFLGMLGILTFVTYKEELHVLERDLTCPTGVVAAIVGDSRVEYVFDPEEIPWLMNYGQSGSPFQVTAQKARIIANQNPNLQFLAIDIWPRWFFDDVNESFEGAANGDSLVELMTRENMPSFDESFLVRLSAGMWRQGLYHMITGIHRAKSSIAGGFAPKAATMKDGSSFGVDPRPLLHVPTTGELVLESLLSDLMHCNVKIVLTSTPILWYEQRWTEEARSYFEQRMQDLSAKHKVPWLNWLHEYQDRPEYWCDGAHLNAAGAKAFSREKRSELERYLDRR